MTFSRKFSKRPYHVAAFTLGALLLSLWLSAAAFARPAPTPTAFTPDAPAAQNAFAHFVPQAGAPANHGTVAAGTKFTLDLKVNTGGNNNVAASQNYILFDNPNS